MTDLDTATATGGGAQPPAPPAEALPAPAQPPSIGFHISVLPKAGGVSITASIGPMHSETILSIKDALAVSGAIQQAVSAILSHAAGDA